MFGTNTNVTYPLLLIKARGKKCFVEMGKLIRKSGDTIRRLLNPAEDNFELMAKIATSFFHTKKELFLTLDDTLIKKVHSQLMQGSGWFYDTQIGRKIRAYKLLCSALTDGNHLLPLGCAFLFDKDLLAQPVTSKNDLVKEMILYALKLFPTIKLIVVADGAFASQDLLGWCIRTNIHAEMRMHSNRKVEYGGNRIAIRDIKQLHPRGRQRSRTIKVSWHGLPLYVTAHRRINKHHEESVVFQVATYLAKPRMHIKAYRMRWPIEKFFRTTKQFLGLQECFSTNLNVQLNHISSVFLAFSLAQLEQKYQRFKTPEQAIRALKFRNVHTLKRRFVRLDQIFGDIYA